MLRKDLQLLNALIPIEVNEFGREIDDKFSHLLNANSSMLTVLLGRLTDLNDVQDVKMLSGTFVILFERVAFVILLQLLKAPFPTVITLSGIVTDVKLLHDEKALSPMVITFCGIVTLARLVQL